MTVIESLAKMDDADIEDFASFLDYAAQDRLWAAVRKAQNG